MIPDSSSPSTRRLVVVAALLALAVCVPSGAQTDAGRFYDIEYRLSFDTRSASARARIGLGRGAANLKQLRFRLDPDRHSRFEGDGEITRTNDNELIWRPPESGGGLSYDVRITNQRRSGSFDAFRADDWAVFRLGDAFPPATSRTLKGALSRATLVLDLPDDWSAATRYRAERGKLVYPFDTPDRRFDRPTGWAAVGQVGVRRATVAGTRVAIAAPAEQGMRRMDVMAMLNWTLPGIRAVFPTLGERLLIVGAADPMWRGGLSGPGSLFLHADRPLISENGTSTLVHELIHVAMGISSGAGHDDWLVEGIAEYYSVKLLRTSGSLSASRMEKTLKWLAEWGDDVDDLFVRRSSGKITARAATVLAEVDRQLAASERSLDDVMAVMLASGKPFNYRSLCAAAAGVMGAPVAALDPKKVPGAPPDSMCKIDR